MFLDAKLASLIIQWVLEFQLHQLLSVHVIEKHFTLSRDEGGIDSAFSLEPDEFRLLRTEVDRAWQSLGSICFGTNYDDSASVKHRRSIYIAKNLKKGIVLTKVIYELSVCNGLPPKFIDVVLYDLTSDVHTGTPLTWELFK